MRIFRVFKLRKLLKGMNLIVETLVLSAPALSGASQQSCVRCSGGALVRMEASLMLMPCLRVRPSNDATQLLARMRPVPTQMWQRHAPAPMKMWQAEHSRSTDWAVCAVLLFAIFIYVLLVSCIMYRVASCPHRLAPPCRALLALSHLASPT